MPQNKDLKRLVRARMAESGENCTQALMLLRGAGAVDLARPRFEEASVAVPVTALPQRDRVLPDEPQALDFG